MNVRELRQAGDHLLQEPRDRTVWQIDLDFHPADADDEQSHGQPGRVRQQRTLSAASVSPDDEHPAPGTTYRLHEGSEHTHFGVPADQFHQHAAYASVPSYPQMRRQ